MTKEEKSYYDNYLNPANMFPGSSEVIIIKNNDFAAMVKQKEEKQYLQQVNKQLENMKTKKRVNVAEKLLQANSESDDNNSVCSFFYVYI